MAPPAIADAMSFITTSIPRPLEPLHWPANESDIQQAAVPSAYAGGRVRDCNGAAPVTFWQGLTLSR